MIKKIVSTIGIAIGGIFVFAFVVGIIGAVSASNRTQSSTASSTQGATPPQTAVRQPPVKPIDVSASDLASAYKDNEVLADEMFKGRPLAVTGKVHSITKDFMDNIIVLLVNPNNQFEHIHAEVEDSEKGKAARLSRGSMIVMVCVGGGMIIGSPILNKCQILD
jgi:hypothetical protein